LRLIHSILLLIVIIVVISVMTPPKCLAKDSNMQSLYFEALAILAVWIFQHVGGMIVRSIIDIEMSIYQPIDPAANRVIQLACFVCGP
jgi:hypothetical protein